MLGIGVQCLLLRSKQMAESETQLVEIDNSGAAMPTRTEVLESKLRILQEVSAQKEKNHIEERQRLEAVSPALKYIFFISVPTACMG